MRSSLPIDLRYLANHVRNCARLRIGMGPDECGRVAVLLQLASQDADALVAVAADVPELEDELLAVAHDPNRTEPPAQSQYQAALREQQRQIQRELEAEGPEPVSRPGLAALAMPIAGSNVTVFPVAPRPRPLGGGDAA